MRLLEKTMNERYHALFCMLFLVLVFITIYTCGLCLVACGCGRCSCWWCWLTRGVGCPRKLQISMRRFGTSRHCLIFTASVSIHLYIHPTLLYYLFRLKSLSILHNQISPLRFKGGNRSKLLQKKRTSFSMIASHMSHHPGLHTPK